MLAITIWSGDVYLTVIQRLANLVGENVRDAADVVAESRRILLYVHVAQLHDPIANGRRCVLYAV